MRSVEYGRLVAFDYPRCSDAYSPPSTTKSGVTYTTVPPPCRPPRPTQPSAPVTLGTTVGLSHSSYNIGGRVSARFTVYRVWNVVAPQLEFDSALFVNQQLHGKSVKWIGIDLAMTDTSKNVEGGLIWAGVTQAPVVPVLTSFVSGRGCTGYKPSEPPCLPRGGPWLSLPLSPPLWDHSCWCDDQGLRCGGRSGKRQAFGCGIRSWSGGRIFATCLCAVAGVMRLFHPSVATALAIAGASILTGCGTSPSTMIPGSKIW